MWNYLQFLLSIYFFLLMVLLTHNTLQHSEEPPKVFWRSKSIVRQLYQSEPRSVKILSKISSVQYPILLLKVTITMTHGYTVWGEICFGSYLPRSIFFGQQGEGSTQLNSPCCPQTSIIYIWRTVFWHVSSCNWQLQRHCQCWVTNQLLVEESDSTNLFTS